VAGERADNDAALRDALARDSERRRRKGLLPHEEEVPDVPLATASRKGLLSAADFAKLAALYQAPPSCRAFHNAAQAIANTTIAALAFNAERFDTHAFHDPATNNSRLTVPAGLGGLYLLGGHVTWAAGAGNRRQVAIRLNGATTIEVADQAGAGSPSQSATTTYRLAAGDYAELTVYQDSGGALNVSAFSNFSPEFWLIRMGD
jgi:hypothetical protein